MPDSSPYSPNDSGVSLASLEFLQTPKGAAFRETLAYLPKSGPTVAQIAKLRKQVPANVLHAALVLAKLQPKALAKFPKASYVWAVPEALEQATGSRVAAHKALRFASCHPTRIYDLCAGIGGDTLALADMAPVTAVDLSPVRMRCLMLNASSQSPPPKFPVTAKVQDIQGLIATLPADACVHIDPSRRWNDAETGPGSTRRSVRFEDMIPGPSILQQITARVAGVLLKLSPAVDFASLPPGNLELISHQGTVVQAILWSGKLMADSDSASRTATVLSQAHATWSFTGTPGDVTIEPVPAIEHFLKATAKPHVFLYELDGTVTRAGLTQPYADHRHLTPLTTDGGYLLGPEGAPPLTDPPLTAFQLCAVVPFSVERVIHALVQLPQKTGTVEVKCRGRLPGVETDELQRTWSKKTASAYTVLLFRYQNDTVAAIATRRV